MKLKHSILILVCILSVSCGFLLDNGNYVTAFFCSWAALIAAFVVIIMELKELKG